MAAALVLMAGVAFCTVSCQEDPITGPAEFSIVDAEVSVPAEGGVFSATYTLDNPVLGEEVKITCDADWISDINTLTLIWAMSQGKPQSMWNIMAAVIRL